MTTNFQLFRIKWCVSNRRVCPQIHMICFPETPPYLWAKQIGERGDGKGKTQDFSRRMSIQILKAPGVRGLSHQVQEPGNSLWPVNHTWSSFCLISSSFLPNLFFSIVHHLHRLFCSSNKLRKAPCYSMYLTCPHMNKRLSFSRPSFRAQFEGNILRKRLSIHSINSILQTIPGQLLYYVVLNSAFC